MFPWFTSLLQDAIDRGIIIVNVSQCLFGSVEMHRYQNGQKLEKLGVISGHDLTTEAALAKMMYLFGRDYSSSEVNRLMQVALSGELSL